MLAHHNQEIHSICVLVQYHTDYVTNSLVSSHSARRIFLVYTYE